MTISKEIYISPKEWREWYPAEEYKNKVERAARLPFHYLLALDQPEKNIYAYMPKNFKALAAKDPKIHQLTPLMIAAMQGKSGIVAEMLKYEVNINERDQFGWTALHHAAICSKEVFDQLIAAGADRENLTGNGASIGDLQQLTSLESEPASLKNLSFESGPFIPQAVELAKFRDLPYYGPGSLKQLWQTERQRDGSIVQQIKDKSANAPAPKLTVYAIRQGLYGLKADQDLEPGTVIGEYAGEVTKLKPDCTSFSEGFTEEYRKKSAYLFGNIDARNFGNATRFINCGFPNAFVGNIAKNGVDQLMVLTIEPVKKGEVLLFDYGADAREITYGPQILFNKEKMRAFFKPGLEPLLAACYKVHMRWQKQPSNISLYLERVRHFAYLIFPLNNPLALIDLHFSGIVPAKAWLKKFYIPDNEVLDAWTGQYSYEAFCLQTFLEHITRIDHNLQTKKKGDYPLFQQFFLKHLESFTLMNLSKALQWVEEALLEGDLNFEERVLNQLKTYDWTKDETNLYSDKNQLIAKENELDYMIITQYKDLSNFFQLKREMIEKTLSVGAQIPQNDNVMKLQLIKEKTPTNGDPSSYLAKVVERHKTLMALLN